MKKYFFDILLSCVAIILPLKMMMITTGFLIMIDFITGLWSSVKNGEDFSSKKMANTISKSVLYQLAIISGFLIETYVITHLPFSMVELIAGFICLIELRSISENIFKITNVNFFSSILEFLKRNNKLDNIKIPKK